MDKNSAHDAAEFDQVADDIFKKAYPVMARQAIERTGINSGVAIDLGSGGGHFGIAVAKQSDLEVYLYDISKEAIEIARQRVAQEGLTDRVKPINGDVHAMPFVNNSVDLVISRGSLWFWEDQVKAFKEISRILKAEGKAYVGGGFGNREIKAKIDQEMTKKFGPDWKPIKKFDTPEEMAKKVIKADIADDDFEITVDSRGFWILIRG
ncbi:MAG: class I SAM-dependent methyltransferase [Bacillota bacterium]